MYATRPLTISLAGACLVLSLFLPACSKGPVEIKPTGKLLYKGEPYIAKHNGSLTVIFTPVAEEGAAAQNFIAEVNREDGTFVLKGSAGQGLSPGKYRVTINQMVMNATPEINAMNERFSEANTKILRDVTDEKPILIDLAKPDGN